MQNHYTLKTAVKAGSCDICYKQTVKVLTNGSDWFYICLTHLKETIFCTPKHPPPKIPEIKAIDSKDKDSKKEDSQDKDTIKDGPKEEAAKSEPPIPTEYILDVRIFRS